MAPDPWLTFWIACGGLAASLASGFGAIWALTQKHRYLPKPLMLGEAEVSEFPNAGARLEGRWFSFWLENKGNGVAQDVHLYLCSSRGTESEFEHRPTFGSGERLAREWRITSGPGRYDEHGNLAETTGTDEDVRLWVRVTWRQPPRMAKQRVLLLRTSR